MGDMVGERSKQGGGKGGFIVCVHQVFDRKKSSGKAVEEQAVWCVGLSGLDWTRQVMLFTDAGR